MIAPKTPSHRSSIARHGLNRYTPWQFYGHHYQSEIFTGDVFRCVPGLAVN